jgi:hypothetical protein
MEEKPRFPLSLKIFTAAYLVAASVSAIQTANQEFVFYILVMAILIGAVLMVHRHCHLSRPLLWCFSVWGLLHMAGGLVRIPEAWPYNGSQSVLYSLWLIPGKLKYDQIVHAYGFGITTWLCWEALRNGLRRRYEQHVDPTPGLVILCGAGGMGFGAFNEVVEFVATIVIQETNVGGYVNTGWDLVFNAIGATLAGWVIWFRGRNRATRLGNGPDGSSGVQGLT